MGRQGNLFGLPPGHSAALTLFERWWKHYPRKVAKLQAQRSWMQIRPLPDAEFTKTAIDAVERQKRDPKFWEEGGRYIPHPSTWLNDGRYLDEGLEERPTQKTFRETCPHLAKCSTPAECYLKSIKEEA